MTLRQFFSLGERDKTRRRREDRRAGEIIAMFYNANRDTVADPEGMEWQDVFSEWKEVAEKGEGEMLEVMQLLARSTKGTGDSA
jgi:hypothetical protein